MIQSTGQNSFMVLVYIYIYMDGTNSTTGIKSTVRIHILQNAHE